MSKHTSGPWKIGHEVWKIESDHWAIANVCGSDDEALANAHLIAAAPDLLEVCEETLNTLIKLEQTLNIKLSRSIFRLERIIAKAKGESNDTT